jgi:hypothetical protein
MVDSSLARNIHEAFFVPGDVMASLRTICPSESETLTQVERKAYNKLTTEKLRWILSDSAGIKAIVQKRVIDCLAQSKLQTDIFSRLHNFGIGALHVGTALKSCQRRKADILSAAVFRFAFAAAE